MDIINNQTKTCRECGRTLPISEFYRATRNSDGHINRCKDCHGLYTRRYKEKHREKYREYARLYRGKGKRAIPTETCREQMMAKYKVKYAVSSGRLLKSFFCERCWSAGVLHGHHTDYSKPLSVIWLCPECHADAHYKKHRRNPSEASALRQLNGYDC